MGKRALFLVAILFLSLLSVVPVNAATPYVPIHDIQYTTDPSGDSPYKSQTIITRGVVTGVGSKGFFIQNGSGPWSGIYIYLGSSPSVNLGDLVEVKGYVKEYYGLTEISVNTNYGDYVNKIGTAPIPDPVTLQTGEVSQEQWESVLIKVENVEVTDPSLGYGEWEVNDSSGALRIDDLMYQYNPTMGQKLEYIIGVLYYSYGNFKLEPRSAADIKEYVPLIKVYSLEAPTYVIKGDSVTIKVVLKNDGGFDENITFRLSIGASLVLNETIKITKNGKEIIIYNWTPEKFGSHIIKAEIVGYDTKYAIVKVVENPKSIMDRLTTFYDTRYALYYKPTFDKKYAQYLEILSELKEYGVNLGPIEDKIEAISTNVESIEKHYLEYLELKSTYFRPPYSLPLLVHIRSAVLLTKETSEMVDEILPFLNTTLNEVRELPENQTHITIKVVRVLVDSSHGQYYNDQKLQTLITKLETELGWLVDVNYEQITHEVLSKYNILIITNPRSDITDEEAQAIKDWIEEGGGLFISGDWYRYVYYISLNKITEEFGIKFNDDELMDDEQNTGRPYFPLVGEFNLEHPAMKFLNESSQLYYNGDTLDISGNAVWLIRGYESAYAEDEDGNIVKPKGSSPIVAAAVEIGSGKIVAYGSSKALSDDYYGRYIDTNWPFIKGALLWLVEES